MTRTALYRHFDADGCLLYVGISLDAAARLKQHLGASVWAEDIASITIEKHDTREAAEAAERAAIKSERPRFNKVHKAIADGLTVASVCDLIGRKPLADALGVGVNAVAAACVSNQFPARWFVIVTDQASSLGIECPISLFSFVGEPKPRKPRVVKVAS